MTPLFLSAQAPPYLLIFRRSAADKVTLVLAFRLQLFQPAVGERVI
jgi:hypothetical protein